MLLWRFFRRFGLSGEDVGELLELIQAGGVLTQAGVGEHLLHLLKDIYTQTWFVTRFQGDKLSCTRLGSRPGSTFADVIFAFIYHRILGRIRSTAEKEGLHVAVPYSGAKSLWCRPDDSGSNSVAHVVDTTWADDTAVVTDDPSPERLLEKTRRLATVVLQQCRSHGLPQERMGSAFEQARGLVLQNAAIDMATRSSIFGSAVTAVAFNLELWTADEAAWSTLSLGHWRLQRRLLAKTFCGELLFKLQEHEVLHLTHQLVLELTARVKRLGFLTCLVATSSEIVWAVLQWEQTSARQLVDGLKWLARWCPAYDWPVVTEAAWPFRDVFVERFFIREGYNLAPKGFCWLACGKAFQTRSGLGAHYKMMHGRTASYRAFAGGTRCKACGKEYFTEHRLFMHLKNAVRCRGVLLAAGLRHSEPMGAVRSWKKAHGDQAVLCPPQRTAAALTVEPVADVQWSEIPSLQILFQEGLDSLVWFEGSDLQCARSGLLDVLSKGALYEEEFRQIGRRLLEAARVLLFQDELLIWQEVGADNILSLLEDVAENFRSTIFLRAAADGEEMAKPDDQLLFTHASWQAPTETTLNCPGAGPTLHIMPSFVRCGNNGSIVASPLEALQDWLSAQWTQYSTVHIHLPGDLEPRDYYGSRLSAQAFSQSGQIYAVLLRHVATFCWRGGRTHFKASRGFWASNLVLPFLKIPNVFHL